MSLCLSCIQDFTIQQSKKAIYQMGENIFQSSYLIRIKYNINTKLNDDNSNSEWFQKCAKNLNRHLSTRITWPKITWKTSSITNDQVNANKNYSEMPPPIWANRVGGQWGGRKEEGNNMCWWDMHRWWVAIWYSLYSSSTQKLKYWCKSASLLLNAYPTELKKIH